MIWSACRLCGQAPIERYSIIDVRGITKIPHATIINNGNEPLPSTEKVLVRGSDPSDECVMIIIRKLSGAIERRRAAHLVRLRHRTDLRPLTMRIRQSETTLAACLRCRRLCSMGVNDGGNSLYRMFKTVRSSIFPI